MLQALQDRLGSRKAKFWLLNTLFLVSGLLYAMIYVNLPLCLIPGGMHDDGFFILRAVSMAAGHWMGAYDQYTLIKGAGYPMFLAGISVFRIPAPLAHALLVVGAIWLLAWLTQKVCGSLLLTAAVFELTLWNLGPEMSRIVRDAIYHAQFLLCFASLILALTAKGKRRIPAMALSGICFGWLWITREEGLIVLPTFLVIWGYFAFQYIRSGQRKPLFVALGVFAGCAMVLPLFTAGRNLSRYHKFETVDTQGEFAAAISSLESIDQSKELPFMAISREVRDKAYTVSPAFARLRPFLDEPGAPRVLGWKAAGCTYLPASCGDYGVGWFMWAFRDAASLDGDFTDARKSANFFRAVHDDIERACGSGKLSCHHSPLPLVPHLVKGEVQMFGTSFLTLVKMLLFVNPPATEVEPSVGTPDQIYEAAGFTNVNSFVPTAQGVGPLSVVSVRFAKWASTARKFLVRLYSRILPIVLPAGMVAFFAALVLCFLRRRVPLYFIVAMAAWISVITRIFTLAVIDATAFPAISNQYLSVAFPVSCFAALLSFYGVAQVARTQQSEKAAPLPKTFRGVGGARLEQVPAGPRPSTS